jgi:hypothetical protein
VLHAEVFVSQDIGERVELREVQEAAGLQEICDYLSPPPFQQTGGERRLSRP